MNKPDPYKDVDFIEIRAATGMDNDQIKCLKGAFDNFDVNHVDYLTVENIDEILRVMGFRPNAEYLAEIIEEIDEDGSGQIEFNEFCQLSAKFLIEEDEDKVREELKDAFRIYDKDQLGFITTDTLRQILAEIDPSLKAEDLDGIIEEIDEDGSGTMDFDEFCEMMSG